MTDKPRTCSLGDCVRGVVGRGLCRMHYLQQWRAGEVTEQPLRSREHRECPADDDEHEHTAEGCWAQHRCRCDVCAHDRRMERQRRRNRLRAYGREDQIRGDRVPAEPAREHLVQLMAQGFGLERVADAAGVPRSVCLDLKFGRRGSRPQSEDRVVRAVRREYADAILALAADDIEPALLAATGTVRRLQALCVMGWTQTELAEQIGMGRGNFAGLIYGLRERVTIATSERAAAVFGEMWDAPQHGARADHSRRIAARRGWLGPLDWDDIDADAAPPAVEAGDESVDDAVVWLAVEGERPRMTPAERREVVRVLHRERWGDRRIAEHVGMASETVLRIRAELGLPGISLEERAA